MRIALVHKHYSPEHLAEVIDEMKTLGAPVIKAVWMECYGHWAALEGCHRIRAAKALGLVPEIDALEYDDVADIPVSSITDMDNDWTVGELVDNTFDAYIVSFD